MVQLTYLTGTMHVCTNVNKCMQILPSTYTVNVQSQPNTATVLWWFGCLSFWMQWDGSIFKKSAHAFRGKWCWYINSDTKSWLLLICFIFRPSSFLTEGFFLSRLSYPNFQPNSPPFSNTHSFSPLPPLSHAHIKVLLWVKMEQAPLISPCRLWLMCGFTVQTYRDLAAMTPLLCAGI